MTAKIPASPFEQRASKLWGARSSPPGQDIQAAKEPVCAQEGLRFFESPEAVKGFFLQAYRPASLPVAKPKAKDDDFYSDCDSDDTEDALATLQWLELEDEAMSIVGSPKMMRTDVPLTRFITPRDCAAIRRCSMDESSNTRRSLELAARSASAPVFHQALRVEELWRNLPQRSSFNPFANIPDTDGIFSH